MNNIRALWENRNDYHPLTPGQLQEIKATFSVVGELRAVSRAPGYAVSADGRVFSGLLCSWHKECPRELRPIPHKHGYRGARLHVNHRPSLIGIHVLVAEAFLPPPEEGQDRVRHLDGNPANNVAGNLKWGTQKENLADMVWHGRSLKGMKNTNAKLNDRRVELIRGLAEEGFGLSAIALFFGVSEETVRRAVNGKHWGHTT